MTYFTLKQRQWFGQDGTGVTTALGEKGEQQALHCTERGGVSAAGAAPPAGAAPGATLHMDKRCVCLSLATSSEYNKLLFTKCL